MARSFLRGKRVVEELNGRRFTVILPGKKLSYEEGTEKLIELFKRVKK